MARAQKKNKLIEFKGTTLPVVSVTVHSLHPEQLAKTAAELFGDEAFFDGDAAVLELEHIDAETPPAINWATIKNTFSKHGLHVIGVRGGNDALRADAASAGLPSLAEFKRPARASAEAPQESAPPPAPTPPPQAAPPQPEPPPVPPPPPPPPPPAAPSYTPTLVIDRPLRSGQQVYARGADLVVLAAVNPGAEVIADGSIHIYAPLRGRALAGASGSTSARIFTTRFEAELVSVAGVYRTFASGIPAPLAGKPVQVHLSGEASQGDKQLLLAALSTD